MGTYKLRNEIEKEKGNEMTFKKIMESNKLSSMSLKASLNLFVDTKIFNKNN